MIERDAILQGAQSKYRIREKLGQGGIGAVWRARDLGDGQEVAVKVLHNDRFELTDAVYERFVREVEHGKSLRHPNLARVLDWGRYKDSRLVDDFLVMSLIPGKPLSALIPNLPEHSRVPIARGIIAGVNHIHDAGLIHRDLKSNNVLVDAENPVICDFGLMKREQDIEFLTNTLDKLGSLLYISSSQQLNPGAADRLDDIYSLCACLFELFSGERMSIRWAAYPLKFGSAKLYTMLRNVLLEQVPRLSWPTLEALDEAVSELAQRSPEGAFYRRTLRVSRSKLRWAVHVGEQRWKSNITAIAGTLLCPSGGSDRVAAGIACVSRANGSVLWHYNASGKANSIAVEGNRLFFGDLGGQVHCITTAGASLWRTQLAHPVLAKPVVTLEGLVVFDDHDSAYLLDLSTGALKTVIDLGTSVIADPVPWDSVTAAVSRDGAVVFIHRGSGAVVVNGTLRAGVHWDSPAKCVSAATIAGDSAIITFLRETYSSDPPVMLLESHRKWSYAKSLAATVDTSNPQSEIPLCHWWAVDPNGIRGSYGNVRGSAAVADDGTIILSGAYDNGVYALNEQGQVIWGVQLGYASYPHWTTPVIANQVCVVARSDGFLHVLDIPSRRRLTSVYLGRQDGAGLVVAADEEFPDRNRYAEWSTPLDDGLFSTPLIIDGVVYQGSREGWLYCLDGVVP